MRRGGQTVHQVAADVAELRPQPRNARQRLNVLVANVLQQLKALHLASEIWRQSALNDMLDVIVATFAIAKHNSDML